MPTIAKIFTFGAETPQEEIIRCCEEWAAQNNAVLPVPIQFRETVFETRAEAQKCLDGLRGSKNLVAVRFKHPVGLMNKPSEELLAQRKRVAELTQGVKNCRKLYYFDSKKDKLIPCKRCGSFFASEYYGRAFRNNCPLCGADLRDASAVAWEQRAESELQQAQVRLMELEKQFGDTKVRYGFELRWAVGVEAVRGRSSYYAGKGSL